jgi:hypothetical protein
VHTCISIYGNDFFADAETVNDEREVIVEGIEGGLEQTCLSSGCMTC